LVVVNFRKPDLIVPPRTLPFRLQQISSGDTPPIRMTVILPAKYGKIRVVARMIRSAAKATFGRPRGDAASWSLIAVERQDLPQ
jgi:hypothetical protein